MSRKKDRNRIFIALAVLALLALAVIAARIYAVNKSIFDFSKDTIKLDSIDLKYEPNPVLYLSKNCNGIRMGITNDQAFSISEALTKKAFSRPLTHDLAFETLNAFNVKAVYAKIDGMDDGIYTAKILFSGGSLLYQADARPSDMAAFTLRYGNGFAISESLASNMSNVC